MATTPGGRQIADYSNARLVLPSGGPSPPEISSPGQITVENGQIYVFVNGVWNTIPMVPVPELVGDILVGVFTVTPQDDRVAIPNHGLANGDQIKFVLDDPLTCALPFPLNDHDYYHVINARGNDFMVSSTTGGPTVNITDKGVGSNEVWKKG
jgi:hypothetical protein